MPAGLDPDWPTGPTYASAQIRVSPWDPLHGTLKNPTSDFDLLSYCAGIESTEPQRRNRATAHAFQQESPAAQ